eukprot:NODE_4539_length_773_cov_22.606811_g4380_i0.p1 GENE.NODE_4539_length_773_cov_22.606811_g4380_i0~~NODE_4539_length_773_cov_22.606811_g4380_i0.p1  ORF type:complete len:201 (+),score=23.59 NODE_4539_length_773_cov_22.606811_g4380_i0:62-664(+)
MYMHNLIALVLFGTVFSSYITLKIDPNKEECFFEDVNQLPTKVFLRFQVIQGGALDIDVSVTDPHQEIHFSEERFTDAHILFVSYSPGLWKFCFSNRMSTLTTKSVSFQLIVGDPTERKPPVTSPTARVSRSVLRISEALEEIRGEQSYLRTRERVHRDTAESTNTRVLWSSIVQCLALVGLTGWQMMYLQRCFETRRSV